MAHRNKNLLEAFQASSSEESERLADQTPSVARSGGPFARKRNQKTALPPPEEPRDPADTANFLDLHPRQLQRLIAVQIVLLIAAFLLGRASVGRDPVEAAPGETLAAPGAGLPPAESGSAAEATPAGPEVAGAAYTDVERALLDPANKYTIKLCEYESNPNNRVLASETLAFLLDEDLPAAVFDGGKRIVILVGAAKEQVALDDLLERAKTMAGPPPRRRAAEFHDAYLERIDRFVDRD